MALDKENSEEKKKRTFFDAYGCKWTTAGRKCQMLGAMTSDVGSQHLFCAWHFIARSNPNILQSFEEFTAWREKDRETYPKVWEHSGLYVNDNLVWACILGKEQRSEYVKSMIAIEGEIEIVVKEINKTALPTPPEFSAQKLANSFDDLPF